MTRRHREDEPTNYADAEWRHDSLTTDDGRSRRLQHLDPFNDYDPTDAGNYS